MAAPLWPGPRLSRRLQQSSRTPVMSRFAIPVPAGLSFTACRPPGRRVPFAGCSHTGRFGGCDSERLIVPDVVKVGAQDGQRNRLVQLILAIPVSYTHLRAHETRHDLVCRLLLEK